MGKNTKDEKELFAPIATITAEPRAAAEQAEEPKKRPAPRPDKTDHYYLMVNGEMANIYDTAVDAVKGLKDQEMRKYDDVYLRDTEGGRMASKTLAVWEADKYTFPVAKFNENRFVPQFDFGNEIRHDLAAEGFDPERVTEIEQQIEENIEVQIEEKLAISQPIDWREALGIETVSELKAEVEHGSSVDVVPQPNSWREALGVEVNSGFQAEVEQGPSTEAAQQPQNWREALGVDWAREAQTVDLSSPDASTKFFTAVRNLRQQLDAEAAATQPTYNTDPDIN